MARDTTNTTAVITKRDRNDDGVPRQSALFSFAVLFLLSLFSGPLLFGATRHWGLAVLAAGISFSWLILLLFSSHKKPFLWTGSTTDYWVLLAGAAALTASFFSAIPFRTALDLLRGTSCLGAFYGMLHLCRGRKETRWVCQLLTLFGGVLSGFGLGQLAGGFPKDWWHRPNLLSATYVNHNHFAGFLELMLPIGLAMALYEKDRAKKALYGFACLLMMTAFIFTLSRAGLIAVTIGLLVFFMALHRRGFALTLLPFAAFGGILIAAVLTFGTDSIQERLRDTQKMDAGGDLSLRYRLMTWEGASNLLAKNPLKGTGPGTFEHVFLPFRPVVSSFRPVHAHNDYLEILADTGGPALLFLMAAALVLIAGAWKKLVHFESRFHSAITAASLAGLVSILVHGCADFNWHIPANAVFVSAIAGLLASQSARRVVPISLVVRWAVSVVLIIITVWSILSGVSDAYLQSAEKKFEAGRYRESLQASDRSVIWNPWNAEAYYRRALARSSTHAAGSDDEAQLSLQTSARDLAMAVQHNSFEPYYDLNHAALLLDHSSDEPIIKEAFIYLDKAVSKDPLNAQLYLKAGFQLASIVAAQPRWRPDLERYWGRAIELDPALAVSIFQALSRRARYSVVDLQRFYRNNPKGLAGWLKFLEHHELWAYHRIYLLESLKNRPPIFPFQSWVEVKESRAPFRSLLSSAREVDVQIQPSYQMSGTIHIPSRESRLCVTARGTSAFRAYPYLYVRLDGEIVDSIYVGSTQFETYFVPLKTSIGNHTLMLHYANDHYDRASKRHRNLWIRDIVLETPDLSGEGVPA